MSDVTQWIRFGLLAGLVTTAAVTDLRRGIVPNWLTLPAILAGPVIGAVLGGFAGGADHAATQAWNSVVGFLAGFIPMALIYALGGFGGGDVKLIAAVGAVSASWMCVLSTAFYALLLAAVLAVGIMVQTGTVRQTLGRLASAAVSAASRVRANLPEDSPRVPFAVAVCLGGILAGVEHLLGFTMPWT